MSATSGPRAVGRPPFAAAWRLLLSGPGEPGFNMALDEALALAVRRGWSPPTLRIYQWQQPAISLGCHQPLSVLEAFDEHAGGGAVVVRRPTGGGAVLHTRDVSYALVCDQRTLRGQPSRFLYRQFHAALGLALGESGCRQRRRHHLLRASGRRQRYTMARGRQGVASPVPAEALCFQQPVANDLLQGRAKVAGAAQRRWRDGLLQQGTVVEPTLSRDRVALCIRTAWDQVFNCHWTVGALTVQERVLADELWSKYRPWTPSSWLLGTRDALSR